MKKLISLALVLVMVAALFAGCGKTDAEKLVGTWKGEMDMTKAIKDQMGEEMAEVDIGKFAVTVVFSFTEEGNYTMKLDDASVEQAVNGLMEKLKEYLKTSLEAEAQAAGMTVDDMMGALGVSMDEFLDSMMESMAEQDLTGEVVESAKAQGKFVAEDGKLHLSESIDTLPDENVYDTYTLEGDTLTLTATYGADEEEQELMKSVYPITLKKSA